MATSLPVATRGEEKVAIDSLILLPSRAVCIPSSYRLCDRFVFRPRLVHFLSLGTLCLGALGHSHSLHMAVLQSPAFQVSLPTWRTCEANQLDPPE